MPERIAPDGAGLEIWEAGQLEAVPHAGPTRMAVVAAADSPLWLGLDVGTQGTKALLLDADSGASWRAPAVATG